MKIQKSSKLVSSFVAAIVATMISAPLALAEDMQPLAPPAASDVSNETSPVAPIDNPGMGSVGESAPQEAPAEKPTKHRKKKKLAKKKKKAAKKAKHAKKKKRKHHA